MVALVGLDRAGRYLRTRSVELVEHDSTTALQEAARTAELREAIDAAGWRGGTAPIAEFSADGGVTVADHWGRSARVQPLGQRMRVSLADQGQWVAEGEVDAEELLARMAVRDNPYDAVADALDEQNGPGYRSR